MIPHSWFEQLAINIFQGKQKVAFDPKEDDIEKSIFSRMQLKLIYFSAFPASKWDKYSTLLRLIDGAVLFCQLDIDLKGQLVCGYLPS
jgi:hypothetical protein